MVRALGLFLAAISLAALACGSDSSEDATNTRTEMPDATATLAPGLAGFSATLERTECFGTCPSYVVTIRGDGTVLDEGRRFVEAVGERTATVSADDVRRLVEAIEDIDYFSLDVPTVSAPEVCGATDAPGYATTIALGDMRRSIARCPNFEPNVLSGLEDLIDEVAGTERWIGDRGLD